MPTQQPGPLGWTPAQVVAAVIEATLAVVIGVVLDLPWYAWFPVMLACFLHGSVFGRVSPLVVGLLAGAVLGWLVGHALVGLALGGIVAAWGHRIYREVRRFRRGRGEGPGEP